MMTIKLGNAPCSWGVEFADDSRNPSWQTVLQECAEAGYKGIELGPVGYMPEEPTVLRDHLATYDLTLTAGVVFQPFHDANQWDKVLLAAKRTCQSLYAHDAQHLVIIDSISSRRAQTAGRYQEAEKMDSAEWQTFIQRITDVAKMAQEEFGLIPSIHPHAGGFIDFLPDIERLMDAVDADTLKICIDTGHSVYAGFDPIPFIEKHIDRIHYIHLKSTHLATRKRVIDQRIGFYDACAEGIFCRLRDGEVDFEKLYMMLTKLGYKGWCTVEQDCHPELAVSPMEDARANRIYLQSVGF